MSTDPQIDKCQEKLEHRTGNLISFKKDMESLISGINLLKAEIKAQKIPFQVQNVILNKQWQEFSDVQTQIDYLKKKLQFEASIHENLKQICLDLSFDEENLHILRNGSFLKDSDLVMMEKSLGILSDFSSGKYDIDIMEERKAEISEVILRFLKRFVMFLSKIFIESASRSELKVHTDFFNSIKKFRFIYKASKSNQEYYNVLCKSYLRKAMDLYNKEFHSHLSRISELIKDKKGLEIAIETIVRSYICLLESESDFMKLMGIDSDPKEIFSDVDSMIINFIDLFYKRSSYCVLGAISQFLEAENVMTLGSLGEALKKKSGSLNEIFIHQHKISNISFDLVELINHLNAKNINTEFCKKLTNLVFEKAVDPLMNKTMDVGIKNIQIMHCLQDLDKVPKAISLMKQRLTEKVVDAVFTAEDIKSPISNIFGYLDRSKKGLNEMRVLLKEIILENCDEAHRNEAIRVLAKF